MPKKPRHCFLCQQIPKNILSLSCDHILCLPCAAELTIKDEQGYSIGCSICEEETGFDKTLFDQLQKELKKSRVSQSSKKEEEYQYQGRSNKKDVPEKKVGKYCQEHKDIDLAYVCKTCKNILICPQCIIKGPHHGHQVITIQEQGKHIKTSLEGQLSALTHALADLKVLESSRTAMIMQRKHELQDLRCSIKRQYEEIKQAIWTEEEAVLGRCNQLIAAHSKEESIFREQMTREVQNIENKRAKISEFLAPFHQSDQIVSSRTHFKDQTMTLISNYFNLEQSKAIPSLLLDAGRKQSRNHSSYDVNELIREVAKINADKYKKKEPYERLKQFQKEGLVVRPEGRDKILILDGNEGFCSKDKGKSRRMEYFNLL